VRASLAANLAEERLQDALAGAYRRDAPSVFVIEGLLMYLTDAQIAVLFAAIAELQRAPGTLVFTVMEPASDGRPRFHNATLRARYLAPSGRQALPLAEGEMVLVAERIARP